MKKVKIFIVIGLVVVIAFVVFTRNIAKKIKPVAEATPIDPVTIAQNNIAELQQSITKNLPAEKPNPLTSGVQNTVVDLGMLREQNKFKSADLPPNTSSSGSPVIIGKTRLHSEPEVQQGGGLLKKFLPKIQNILKSQPEPTAGATSVFVKMSEPTPLIKIAPKLTSLAKKPTKALTNTSPILR
jgi:hypothetical protein